MLPTLPPEEAECLRRHYEAARVILEYGSGGSTRLAAEMPGKYVLSVESDRDWAIRLQRELDEARLPSSALVWHVDIGATGAWGRPKDDRAWARFHRYPMAIWDQPFFRHPDVILIDGRFRAACFAAACLRIARPVTVLFDDYVGRPRYHLVEVLAQPAEVVGRMAVFRIEPGRVAPEDLSAVMGMFSQVTYARQRPDPRPAPADKVP
jgi:hypothetical protein